jgi:hypothetical protein
MSRSKLKEATVSMFVGHSGHFTAKAALEAAGITVADGVKLEIDRKLVCEENEDFEIDVTEELGEEYVNYTRTGDRDALVDVWIYLHYE